MIPILYKSTETNFSHNGLGLLVDTISCYSEEKRNGSYELELIYPISSFLFSEIKGQRIIKAKANDRYDNQLFRIYYISKPLNGRITVRAEHISYRLKDNFVEKLNFEGNCAGFLNALNNATAYPSGFNFNSDISITGKYRIERRNLWECIVGKEDSALSTYGKNIDIVRDNFNLSIKANAGQDKNVLIAYKKNMTGFSCEEDWSGCITRIYPYATIQDNNIITLKEKYIDSSYINHDENPKISEIDFTSFFSKDEEITENGLRKKAKDYFKNNNVDIPSLKWNIEFVALSKTEEYKNQGLTEDIGMFDQVIVRHEIYNLDSKIKVIYTQYDTIAEKYIKIGLGEAKENLSHAFNNVSDEIKKSNKDKVTIGFLDKSIKELSDAITGNDGGYIVLNPPENPSELLVLDNEDISKARIVWRWNKEGLGVSQNGYNGQFLGLAKNGKLVIDEATANKINACLIQAGMLKSLNNVSWINMDDGSFNFGDGALTFNKSTGLGLYQGNIALNNEGIEIQNSKFIVYNPDGEVGLNISKKGFVTTRKGFSVINRNNDDLVCIDRYGIEFEYTKENGKTWTYGLYPVNNGIKTKHNFTVNGDVTVNKDLYVDEGINVEKNGYIKGDLEIKGDLDVRGSKPCLQSTEHYGKRRITAYETAEYYFGDIGSGVIKDGECIVTIENMFSECVNTNIEYQVFTQSYNGTIIKIERFSSYFIVYGEDNTEFAWEIKAKRLGYENIRLEKKPFLKEVLYEIEENQKDINVDLDLKDVYNNQNEIINEFDKYLENNLEKVLLN